MPAILCQYGSYLLTGLVVQSTHFQKLPLPVLFFERSFFDQVIVTDFFQSANSVWGGFYWLAVFLPQNLIGNHFGQHGMHRSTQNASSRREGVQDVRSHRMYDHLRCVSLVNPFNSLMSVWVEPIGVRQQDILALQAWRAPEQGVRGPNYEDDCRFFFQIFFMIS